MCSVSRCKTVSDHITCTCTCKNLIFFILDPLYTAYDWKTARNLCLNQNKQFGGKSIWKMISKKEYNPNASVWLNGFVLRSPIMEYYGKIICTNLIRIC